MNIKIGEDYKVTSDSNNLILLRKRLSDPNHHFSKGVVKESWEVSGYFGKTEHLINHLIEKEVRSMDVTSFEEVIKKLEELKNHLVVELDKAIPTPEFEDVEEGNE